MATFTKRKSGYWQAKIRRRGQATESQTFITKKAAEEWARDIESKLDRGIHVSLAEAKAITLNEALARYDKEVSRLKNGYPQEKYRIRAWQGDRLAQKSLAALCAANYATGRDERRAASAAPATVKNDLALISNLFTVARRDWGLGVQNPLTDIRPPQVNNERDRRLEDGEEEYLVEAIANTGSSTKSQKRGDRSNIWMLPLVLFGLETALRRGENARPKMEYGEYGQVLCKSPVGADEER